MKNNNNKNEKSETHSYLSKQKYIFCETKHKEKMNKGVSITV